MNQIIEEYLIEARQQQAQGLWVCPTQTPKMRRAGRWEELSTRTLSSADTRSQLTNLLGDLEKREFFEAGAWSGLVRIKGDVYRMALELVDSGIAGHFQWMSTQKIELESWTFPSHLIESLMSRKGLHLVVGPQGSGKTTLMNLLAGAIAKKNAALVQYYTPILNFNSYSEVVYRTGSQIQGCGTEPYDHVFVDDPSLKMLSFINEQVDAGKSVTVSIVATDLFAGLKKWQRLCESQNMSSFDELSFAIGTLLVSATDGALTPASEYICFNEKLKSFVKTSDWSELKNEMNTSVERPQTRSLNQSLLSLVLKRKIDIKGAFEKSRDPDHLDVLLKKVGI